MSGTFLYTPARRALTEGKNEVLQIFFYLIVSVDSLNYTQKSMWSYYYWNNNHTYVLHRSKQTIVIEDLSPIPYSSLPSSINRPTTPLRAARKNASARKLAILELEPMVNHILSTLGTSFWFFQAQPKMFMSFQIEQIGILNSINWLTIAWNSTFRQTRVSTY